MKKSKIFNIHKMRNFRLIYGILTIWIISCVSTLITGFIGYTNLSKMNNNIAQIYSKQIVTLRELGNIEHNFGMINFKMAELINVMYNSSYGSAIEDSDVNMKKSFGELENIELNSSNKKRIDDLIKNYDDYISNYKIIKDLRMQNKIIDVNFEEKIKRVRNAVHLNLSAISDLYESDAKKVMNDNARQYQETKRLFLSVLGMMLLVVSIISLFIIFLIKTSIKDFSNILHTLSTGDFTVNMDTKDTNEFGMMKKQLGATIFSIADILKKIKAQSYSMNEKSISLAQISSDMNTSSEEVANAINEVSNGSVNQAQELTSITDALNTFDEEVNGIVSSMGEVDSNAQNINFKAQNSNSDLSDFILSINKISTSFQDVSAKITNLGTNINSINEITALINTIADKTDLLALNAAIEAARAGEAGGGFAVVAGEVRKLAEQSKKSAQSINNILKNISAETTIVTDTTKNVSKQLSSQIEVIKNSLDSFKEIIFAINGILPKIEDVNFGIEKINNEKTEIIFKIGNASAVAEQNSASAEEISASSMEMSSAAEVVFSASQSLNEMTKNMIKEIDRFVL